MVKSSQNDHCFFLFSPMPVTSPYRDRPLATPRVAHAGDPRSPCYAILIPCVSLIHFPSPLLLRRAHAEPNRAELIAGPCAGCSSPRLLISLRPKLRSLTPHLLCPSTGSIKPFCGRIEPAIAGLHCQPRRSSAPLVDLPSPATLRPNRARGELPREPLSLPDPFPVPNRRHRRRAATRAAVGAQRRRACHRGPPLSGPQPRGRTPASPLRPGRGPAPPASPCRRGTLPQRVGLASRRPWRGQGRELGAGPPTDMWGPVVRPLFWVLFFNFIYLFRLKSSKIPRNL